MNKGEVQACHRRVPAPGPILPWHTIKRRCTASADASQENKI